MRRQESVSTAKRTAASRLDVTLHEGFLRPADATALLRALTAPRSQGGEGLGLGEGPNVQRSKTWPGGLRSDTTKGTLATIARRIEGVFGLPGGAITYAAIQYYSEREGYRTSIGSHPDREVDDAVGIYCVSLMEDEDATRPLSFNPSRNYRNEVGPVTSEDISLPTSAHARGRPRMVEHKLKLTPPRVSITFRRKRSGAPAPDEERQQICPERRPRRRLRGQRRDLRVQGPHYQKVRQQRGRRLHGRPRSRSRRRRLWQPLARRERFRLETTPSARAPLKAGAARRTARGHSPVSAPIERRRHERRPVGREDGDFQRRLDRAADDRRTDGRIVAAEDRRPHIMSRAAVAEAS